MGAGASSKGKSPGSTAPKISEPPQIGQIGESAQGLGQYEEQFINEPWSLGNWAMNIATGGTGPQVTETSNQGIPSDTSGVQTYSGGTSGTGTSTGTGSTRNPFGGGPPGSEPASIGPSNPTAPAGGPHPKAAKGNIPTPPAGAIPNAGGTSGGGGSGGGGGGGGGGSGGLFGNLPGLLGGFSSGENAAWNVANTQPAGEGQIQGSINQANKQTAQADKYTQQLYNKGQWLTPQQEAMINQQTAANTAAVTQSEGSMGLSGSTQAAQLAGESQLAGTAAKGQLQQGNMQVAQGWQQTAQNWQKVSEGFTALGMSEQSQAFNQFTSIAQLSAGEQAQMFQEGTAGYQLMQTFMGATLQPYGIGLQAFNDILQANTAQVGDQVALQSTAISADQSGQNQVVSGISQVLSSLISDF